jgi:hypothetical protein
MRENRTARPGRSGVAAMAPDEPIVRPLPADEFYVHGLNLARAPRRPGTADR